jgi:crotonobetainyl-CoA:carnitine CoA-transferase CaiB-like acyl-CoA transferase
VPEPHLLSKEQLEENQRRVEAANREVDAEAERELASMSKEQLARVMEEDWSS